MKEHQHRGLTSAQVEESRRLHGDNLITPRKGDSAWKLFAEKFRDPIIQVLLVAALLSLAMAFIDGEFLETIGIICAIVLATCVGFFFELDAMRRFKRLNLVNDDIPVKVVRDGEMTEVPRRDVVVGDLVYVENGETVPADGKLVKAVSLKINESTLTGEPEVDKTTDERFFDAEATYPSDALLRGTTVVDGYGEMIVEAVGDRTEAGRVTEQSSIASEEPTPLYKQLTRLSRMIGKIGIAVSIAIFLAMLAKAYMGGELSTGDWVQTSKELLRIFMVSVALIVMAVPEGLPMSITLSLALSMRRMLKTNNLVRKMHACETMGAVTVICTDKTGTLTQNKMTVQKIYVNGESILEDQLDLNIESHRHLLYDMVLNNDSSIVDGKGIGDPTEYALLETFQHIGLDENVLRDVLTRVEEVPFDSDRKMMSTKYKMHGVNHILTKGALDSILDRCVSIATKDGIRPITDEDKAEISRVNREYSEQGLRVLTFAYKESDEALTVDTENDYTFIGLVSMIDPPREESKQAVADAIRAGIKPVMITGDHKITASAIAKQIGIFNDGDIAVTGLELDAMSDKELDEKIEKISVYARVSPENKIRIVEAWQRKGNIVSMTGDGVNDAPALKKADIGVAMGITGTEVSKDAASMILQDDNFATIIKAVANGRNVYRNIKNAILFLLSGNMAGIFAVLFCSIMALPVPFEAVHLLFINLLTDSLPAIAIGMEKPEKDLLRQKPRDPKQGILTKSFSALMLGQGALIAVVTLISFYIGLQTSPAVASTMAFATLTLARLFHGFNCRSTHSIFKLGLFSNAASIGAFFVGTLLLAFVLFVPFMQPLFSVTALTGAQAGFIALLAFIPTFIIQFVKVIVENVRK